MPGVRRPKRPSGCQQRKAKAARLVQSLTGSMLAFVSPQEEGPGAAKSKDAAAQAQTPIYEAPSPSATPAVEEEVPMEGIEEEKEQEVEIALAEKSASEQSADADDSRDTRRRKDLLMFSDVSSWRIPLTYHLQLEIIKRGSAPFQNKDGPFGVAIRENVTAKGRVRKLSKDWFYRVTPSGEKVLRSWMVYSRVTESLYCFCCRLFAISITGKTSSFVTGFQKWWLLNPKVINHETSAAHRRCLGNWKTLAAGRRLHRTMNAEAIASMEKEKSKWRHVLHKLLEITSSLARQNVAFHGHWEDNSSLKKGNSLERIELLSTSDAVLNRCLSTSHQSTKAKASASFLSPATQNECISVLADHVKEILVTEIKSAGYFGIVFDSTPDVGHTDQTSAVIRYVKINNKKVEVKEVYLGFYPLEGRSAADLSAEILKSLERDGLDIMMCRAHGYNHAASMAAVHGGIQAIIREKNKKAIFNRCGDCPLNWCGRHSFDVNASCMNFFGTFESLFSFFAASTKRWDVLTARTGALLKRLSANHWSSHPAAVKPVRENFDQVVAAIEALCEPPTTAETRCAAKNILSNVLDFTFLCYLYLWGEVLEEVNDAQEYLQREGLALDKVVTKVEELRLSLQENRNHLVERAIELALLKAEECEVAIEGRVGTKKRMPRMQASDVGLTLQEENKRVMLECLHRFHSELQSRARGIKEVTTIFEAVQATSLIAATDEQLKVSVPKLTTFCDEISESELLKEIESLRRHLGAAQIDPKAAKNWSVEDLLSYIAEWELLESLPNLSRSLQLCLTVSVSVASCENSSTKLKLIKNYLRSANAAGQPWLSSLAMLSVECELVKGVDFDEVIDRFAALKARKGNFRCSPSSE